MLRIKSHRRVLKYSTSFLSNTLNDLDAILLISSSESSDYSVNES